MGEKKKANATSHRPQMPASTPEAREKQLIAMTYDTVEKRIANNEASSAELCHFLKMGSIEKQLELEKLKKENDLLKAKTEALEATANSEQLFKQAIEAFTSYTPVRSNPNDEEIF